MNENCELLKIENTDICYICGSNIKHYSDSFHCWVIEYECGCKIWGPISNDDIYNHTKCSNLK